MWSPRGSQAAALAPAGTEVAGRWCLLPEWDLASAGLRRNHRFPVALVYLAFWRKRALSFQCVSPHLRSEHFWKSWGWVLLLVWFLKMKSTRKNGAFGVMISVPCTATFMWAELMASLVSVKFGAWAVTTLCSGVLKYSCGYYSVLWKCDFSIVIWIFKSCLVTYWNLYLTDALFGFSEFGCINLKFKKLDHDSDLKYPIMVITDPGCILGSKGNLNIPFLNPTPT